MRVAEKPRGSRAVARDGGTAGLSAARSQTPHVSEVLCLWRPQKVLTAASSSGPQSAVPASAQGPGAGAVSGASAQCLPDGLGGGGSQEALCYGPSVWPPQGGQQLSPFSLSPRAHGSPRAGFRGVAASRVRSRTEAALRSGARRSAGKPSPRAEQRGPRLTPREPGSRCASLLLGTRRIALLEE